MIIVFMNKEFTWYPIPRVIWSALHIVLHRGASKLRDNSMNVNKFIFLRDIMKTLFIR